MNEQLNIYQRLLSVQEKLKAPKIQKNTFANYNYRSCEDILEAVKPLLKESGLVLSLYDEVNMIGDRYYVTATAKVINSDKPDEVHQATASAREEEIKKGADGSQITGTSSSYARKYALNGLFLIDDTKDADTDEHTNQTASRPAQAQSKSTTPIAPVKSPDDPVCEIAGCHNTVYKSKEELNRKYHDGRVICYLHSTTCDWRSMPLKGQEIDEEPTSYDIASQA